MKNDELCCLECRFFSPGEIYGSPASKYIKQVDAVNKSEGVCRFNSPQIGKTIKNKDGEAINDFGQWPRVFWCDWCGRFEQRQTESMPEGFS